MSRQWWPDVHSVIVYLPAVLVAATFVLLFAKRKTWGRPVLFVAGYFIVMLLPVLGVVWMTMQQETLCADWWQYFAAPGVFAGIAAAIVSLTNSATRPVRLTVQVALCFASCVLLSQTWRRGASYRSMETYCRAVLSENPHFWSIQTNLGTTLEHEGKFDEAIACHQQAVRDNPRFMEAHNNLGNCLAKTGDLVGAESEYLAALKLAPSSPDVLGNLADLYFRQGKTGEALGADAQAIRNDRYNSARYLSFGVKLAANHQLEQAAACFKNAHLLNEDDIDTDILLVRTLIAQGQTSEASRICREAYRTADQAADHESMKSIASLWNECSRPGRD
jgi:Flp pilus assembly protein TadD